MKHPVIVVLNEEEKEKKFIETKCPKKLRRKDNGLSRNFFGRFLLQKVEIIEYVRLVLVIGDGSYRIVHSSKTRQLQLIRENWMHSAHIDQRNCR